MLNFPFQFKDLNYILKHFTENLYTKLNENEIFLIKSLNKNIFSNTNKKIKDFFLLK